MVSQRYFLPIYTVIILFAGLLFVTPDATGDNCGFCRGKPLPECSTFYVLESGWALRLDGTNVRPGQHDWLLSMDFGLMRNVSDRSAVGGTMFLSADDDGSQMGLRARYRYWLNSSASLDISPGVSLGGQDNRYDLKYPGFVGSASLSYKDWLAVTVRYHAARYDTAPNWPDLGTEKSGTRTGTYAGIRFGSYAAIVFPVALMILAVSTYSN